MLEMIEESEGRMVKHIYYSVMERRMVMLTKVVE